MFACFPFEIEAFVKNIVQDVFISKQTTNLNPNYLITPRENNDDNINCDFYINHRYTI